MVLLWMAEEIDISIHFNSFDELMNFNCYIYNDDGERADFLFIIWKEQEVVY